VGRGTGGGNRPPQNEGRRNRRPRRRPRIAASRSVPQNVPGKLLELPLVSSVIVTSLNATVIGGLQSGWKVAVTVRMNSALPFWTGKSPAAETLSLLAAFG
jgi:hypothetical protein